ncbi:MAG: hydrogenase maturation nickel metallochaperone HypA [Firmicutes bacterium]|nr:hydrogenase maturation nickel metallochaperone HypA [Bacillota bacterium]
MHETSLIEFTLKAVEQKALSMGIDRVQCIHLVIGKERGVVGELMDHAFELLTSRRPLFAGCRLDIESVDGDALYIDSFEGSTDEQKDIT